MRAFHILAFSALLVSGALSVAAETKAADDNEARARATLRRATKVLEDAKALRVSFEASHDIRQDSGLMLEFGETRALELRRPDRLKVEVVRRDGARGEFYFDGKKGFLHHPDDKLFSSSEMGRDTDAVLKYLEEEIRSPIPIAFLIRSDVSQYIEQRIESALWVGEERVDGTVCEYVAVRTPVVDVQFWISKTEPPLFRRIILTYVEEDGSPQYRAESLEWELEPELPDELFRFEPPAGSEQAPFVRTGGSARQDAER